MESLVLSSVIVTHDLYPLFSANSLINSKPHFVSPLLITHKQMDKQNEQIALSSNIYNYSQITNHKNGINISHLQKSLTTLVHIQQ